MAVYAAAESTILSYLVEPTRKACQYTHFQHAEMKDDTVPCTFLGYRYKLVASRHWPPSVYRADYSRYPFAELDIPPTHH